jgi:hypothetical protein
LCARWASSNRLLIHDARHASEARRHRGLLGDWARNSATAMAVEELTMHDDARKGLASRGAFSLGRSRQRAPTSSFASASSRLAASQGSFGAAARRSTCPQRVQRSSVDTLGTAAAFLSAGQRGDRPATPPGATTGICGIMCFGPLIAGNCQPPFLMSLPGSGSFPRSRPHDGVRGGCLNVWNDVRVLRRQPKHRGHRHRRPGWDTPALPQQAGIEWIAIKDGEGCWLKVAASS